MTVAKKTFIAMIPRICACFSFEIVVLYERAAERYGLTQTKGETMNKEQMLKEMERLRKENEELQANAKIGAPSLGLKVSTKGAVSVYGLGRFPVTLYKAQWERLLGYSDTIQKFIKDNEPTLAVK